MELTEGKIRVNQIDLHYVQAGKGELMLFLHGFPDFSYIWRHQLPFFSENYHVVAPDLRGYNLSDKPGNKEDYKMSVLVEDVRNLIEQLGYEKCTLVGHDWGGAISWAFAYQYPEYLNRLIIMNAPHPVTFIRELITNPKQREASEYMIHFQKPEAAENLKKNNYEALENLILKPGLKKGWFTEADIEKYKAAWGTGSIEAMLYYYQNLNIFPFEKLKEETLFNTQVYPLEVPALVIWGMKDPAFAIQNLDGLEEYAKNLTQHTVAEAYHSPQQEKPDEVNAVIKEFLAKS